MYAVLFPLNAFNCCLPFYPLVQQRTEDYWWKKMLSKRFLFLCTQKVRTLLESVSMSVRLDDNSSQLHRIELKFCIQNCLINISVKFEDELNRLYHCWLTEKFPNISIYKAECLSVCLFAIHSVPVIAKVTKLSMVLP